MLHQSVSRVRQVFFYASPLGVSGLYFAESGGSGLWVILGGVIFGAGIPHHRGDSDLWSGGGGIRTLD
jgi:hypothetical protein